MENIYVNICEAYISGNITESEFVDMNSALSNISSKTSNSVDRIKRNVEKLYAKVDAVFDKIKNKVASSRSEKAKYMTIVDTQEKELEKLRQELTKAEKQRDVLNYAADDIAKKQRDAGASGSRNALKDIETMMEVVDKRISKLRLSIASMETTKPVNESSIDYLNDCITQAYINGEVPETTYFEMVGLIEEGPISSAKKFLQQIKLIKECKPDEYVGEAEVKKFIDKNYDKLKEIAEYMDEEPSKLKTKIAKSAIGTFVSFGLVLAGMLVGAWPGLLTTGIIITVIGFIGTIVGGVIPCIYSRKSEVDRDVVDNLSKIKRSLKTVDRKKFDVDTAKKITSIINKIEDAETSWNAQIKTESTYEDVAQTIFEAYKDNKISQKQKNQLLGALVESENAKLVSSDDKAINKKKINTAKMINDKYKQNSDPSDTSASAISTDISHMIANLETIRDVLPTTKEEGLKSIKRDVVKATANINTTMQSLNGKQA